MKGRPSSQRAIDSRPGIAILVLWALLCAAGSVVLALEGPVDAPPGGVTMVQTGACTALADPLDECMGRSGGTDLAFTGFDPNQPIVLWWGPEDGSAIGLAFDGAIDAAGETMSFQPGQSDLANGMARWTGTTNISWWNGAVYVVSTVDTRFTLTTANGVGPVPMVDGSSLGLTGTALITVTGDYTGTMLFEAKMGGNWQPALEFFDATNTPPWHDGYAMSEAVTKFYYEELITGLTANNDGPTILGQTTTLSATLTTGTGVSYDWDLGNGQTASGAVVAYSYPAAGTYTAVVTASNLVDSKTARTIVTVDEPISGLNVANDSPTELGQTTHLSATLSQGTNATYAWDLGDGQTANGAGVAHQYGAAGTYTAVVTASNSVGSATDSTLVTVEESIAGLAATNNSPTQVGATTRLTATVRAGTNVAYAWDLGDGQTATGAVVEHKYPDDGTYTAIVTASNAVDTVTAQTRVTITSGNWYVYLPLVLRAHR